MHTERIASLEQKLEKRISDQSEMEKRLRKEMETLQQRNGELETKLVDAASIVRNLFQNIIHFFFCIVKVRF